MTALLRRIERKVRRLLFKPTGWRVVARGDTYPVPTWWTESRSKAGHLQSGPFYSLEDAIGYCERMNS